jgi:hypothetical protein
MWYSSGWRKSMGTHARLHKQIGSVVKELESDNVMVLLAKECGGDHRLPLYCADADDYSSCLCHVDIVVLVNNIVKVIIEIEESKKMHRNKSNIRPQCLLGKLVPVATTHSRYKNRRYAMGSSVWFVQVVDTSGLPETSSKVEQMSNLQEFIRSLLRVYPGPVKEYQMFYGGVEEFDRVEARDELKEHLLHAIAN